MIDQTSDTPSSPNTVTPRIFGPGDKIRDNDPRVGDRILVIEENDGPDHVRARRIFADGRKSSYPKKGFRIKRTRIHTDGKKRKGGFSLMND